MALYLPDNFLCNGDFTANDRKAQCGLTIPVHSDAILLGVSRQEACAADKIPVSSVSFGRLHTADGPDVNIQILLNGTTANSIRCGTADLTFEQPIGGIHVHNGYKGLRSQLLTGNTWQSITEQEFMVNTPTNTLQIVTWPELLFGGAMLLANRAYKLSCPTT